MEAETICFEVEGFDGGVESRRVGDRIEITFQGWPVHGFNLSDPDGRDLAIAALLESKLKGKAIATLCHRRPSQVSKVKQRYRRGGYQAVLRQRRGRKPMVVGGKLQKARKLRQQGLTQRKIAEKLGVCPASLCHALAGMARGGEPKQEELLDQDGFPVGTEDEIDGGPSEAGDPTMAKEGPSSDEALGEEEPAAEVEEPSAADQEVATAEESAAKPVATGAGELVSTPECPPESWAEAEVGGGESADAEAEALPAEKYRSGGDAGEPPAAAHEAPDETPVAAQESAALDQLGGELDSSAARPQELVPGELLPEGPVEHPCRYAGTLLIGAAVQVLGLLRALVHAGVERPEESVYSGWQAIVALLTAWASGFGSIEAMHERDARSLGVVLGLERSLSVRTLHRAIAQMVSVFNPVKLVAALLRGLIAVVGTVPRIFGVDGHFKPYFGKEPIDKGYDTKRRMGHRGLNDMLIHDEQGRIWTGTAVGAGDRLSEHLQSSAETLRRQLGENQAVVLGFDRGGFCLQELDALDQKKFFYVGWVPATVKLPTRSTIAPPQDGVGERRFEHSDLSPDHRARLLVERDGEALVPALTNLPDSFSATVALEMLRRVRGMQENDIKATRAFAHIDRLVDRGHGRRGPDDRLVDNPTFRELSDQRRRARSRLAELERSEPISAKDRARLAGEQFVAEAREGVLTHKLKGMSAKVPRVTLEPEAQRAWLKTSNRLLLQPLKYVLANGRRWLLSTLGSALAPSDHEWDQSTSARTLEALIQAPGTVRFGHDEVVVTLELPLPPLPHALLAQGLVDLDSHGLRFTDGRRRVVFRLAPRPTRQTLPSARPPQ